MIVADENIAAAIVARLRDDGFHVTYIAQEAPAISDREVLERALKEGAILITDDKDFGDLVMREKRAHCGVVLLRLSGVPNEKRPTMVSQLFRENGAQLANAFTVLAAQPVIDEVLGDVQASITLDVGDEVLVAVAVVEDLDDQVQSSALVGHHPCHPRIVLGLGHVEHGEDIGGEDLFPRVEHRQFFGEVDDPTGAPEVQSEGVNRLPFGLLVAPSFPHRAPWIRQGVEDGHEQALALVRAHGAPLLFRGSDRGRSRRRRCPGGRENHAKHAGIKRDVPAEEARAAAPQNFWSGAAMA